MGENRTPEEQKILDRFLDDRRIIRLPAKQKKRLIVLRWLVEKIDPETRYTEQELSALIAQHYPDFATVRRELYEFGFMNRERGVYWRTSDASETRHLEQD